MGDLLIKCYPHSIIHSKRDKKNNHQNDKLQAYSINQVTEKNRERKELTFQKYKARNVKCNVSYYYCSYSN